MNTRIFSTAQIIVITVLFLFIICPLTGHSQSNYDYRLIEELVHRMQRGIQKQKPRLILDYLCNSAEISSLEIEREQASVNNAMSKLLLTFSDRDYYSPIGEESKTRDFRIKIKNIELSANGEAAEVDLEAGFVAAPLDSTRLLELSPFSLSNMSTVEKANYMRYQLFKIKLIKVTHNWQIASLGQFPSILEKMESFFQVNEEFRGASSTKKKY